jgi:hypothetical protein
MLLRAHRSLQLNRVLQRALDSHPEPIDPRASLALASVDLGLEHHRAIARLYRRGEPASGAALLRLLLECGLTATYILHVLSPEDASEMLDGPPIYIEGCLYLVNTGDMVSALSNVPIIGEKIVEIYRKQLKFFHKFTHGDVPQLVRRRQGVPTFSMDEIRDHLDMADAFLLASIYVGAQAVRADSLKRSTIEIRNALMAEILTRKEMAFDPAQYEEVPPDPPWQAGATA